MAKKLILGVLGLGIVVAGIGAFAAFTAQIVNLEAHVEKEIEIAAVKDCEVVELDVICSGDTGNYGTVIPQELYDKQIEVTLSKSFLSGQDKFDDVVFAVLWECKQFADGLDLEDNLNPVDTTSPDGFPDCKYRVGLDHDMDHPNNELDDLLRNYATIVPDEDRCLSADPPFGLTYTKVLPPEMFIDLVGFGVIDRSVNELGQKCFYTIKLLAPPCAGEFNEFTDPLFDPNNPVKTIECHFDDGGGSGDPQDWEHFADIGDEFKIQVIEHSLAP